MRPRPVVPVLDSYLVRMKKPAAEPAQVAERVLAPSFELE
jgi:hypothetical protein